MQFNILTQTLNGKVNTVKLMGEIDASPIPETVSRIDTQSSMMNIYFNSEINEAAEIILVSIVANHDGAPTVEVVAPTEVTISDKSVIQGAIPVINLKPEDSSFTLATHDFCDKTTWFTNSVGMVDETLTTSDDLTYSAVNDFFINVIDAIINRQDLHQDKAIVIKVDDVVVTSGFTINHRNGEVVFDIAQTNKVVKCSYHYATNSEWIIGPSEGKTMIIEHSEVQFAKDVEINTPLRFEIWAGNPYYAVEGHPYQGMPKIPYSNIQYNSVRDLINEANLGTGFIPKMGDMPDDILVFPFNYISVKAFKYSQGAELRIRAVNDLELTGSYGTATFYLLSKDE